MFQILEFLCQTFGFVSVMGTGKQSTAVCVTQHVRMCNPRIPRVQRNSHEIGDSSSHKQIGRMQTVVLKDPETVTGPESE